MKDATPNSQSENPLAGGPITGQVLRDARLAAHLDLNKICNDLRLSPSVIEALEKGEYHLLPGDPYIRALLGSVGRYLNLDTPSLIAGYNREIGATHSAPSVAPYKDRAHTYTTAHKQIFIFVFLGLFILLVLLMGKLNKPDPDSSKQGSTLNPALVESLTLPQDSSVESNSLVPDSMLGPAVKRNRLTNTPAVAAVKTATKISDPAETPTAAQPAAAVKESSGTAPSATAPSATAPSVAAPSAIAPSVAAPSATAPSAAAPLAVAPSANSAPVPVASAPQTQPLNVVVIKPLFDSVGVKVLRTGKEDFATLLRLGKQMQVSHSDTIVVFISVKKAVEVTWGGKSVIPDRKRFKIYGTTLKTY